MTQPITDITSAVKVLNENHWHGRNDWIHVEGESVIQPYINAYSHFRLWSSDAIAIANSLVQGERIAELEALHAGWLVERAELTALATGLEAERDAYRDALAKHQPPAVAEP